MKKFSVTLCFNPKYRGVPYASALEFYAVDRYAAAQGAAEVVSKSFPATNMIVCIGKVRDLTVYDDADLCKHGKLWCDLCDLPNVLAARKEQELV